MLENAKSAVLVLIHVLWNMFEHVSFESVLNLTAAVLTSVAADSNYIEHELFITPPQSTRLDDSNDNMTTTPEQG